MSHDGEMFGDRHGGMTTWRGNLVNMAELKNLWYRRKRFGFQTSASRTGSNFHSCVLISATNSYYVIRPFPEDYILYCER